jgi:acyl-CoA thioesterase II
MNELSQLLSVLDLEPTADGRYRAWNLGDEGSVVFGGQLLAQTIMASGTVLSDKRIATVQTTFARSASVGVPIDLDVDVMHIGRTFSSATVSVLQEGRLCSRSLVLASAAEPDLIRHEMTIPVVDGPSALTRSTDTPDWWDLRTVGAVDVHDPNSIGPAELFAWSRFRAAPADPLASQALLAYASDGLLIGTAMRPHAGIGQAMAHISISTTVVTHTLAFHEPFDVRSWLLLAHESPYAGGGRSYGRASVFSQDGHLVASFVQDAMIRNFPEGAGPEPGRRARH